MMERLGPYLLGPNDTAENGIYTGDARELAQAIPDESVDLIFTDPVYDRIDDYRWLAETAARTLKQGGNLIAQSCSIYRFQAEQAMRLSDLEPCVLLAEVYGFGGSCVFKFRVQTHWKPYIWMSRGKRNGGWIMDSHYSSGGNKRYHKWGDAPTMIVQYILRMTERDAVIFDPFTGGGTVPAVCKMLGRRYLAFEIEPEVAETARERVRNTQPPLFVPQAEQLAMPG